MKELITNTINIALPDSESGKPLFKVHFTGVNYKETLDTVCKCMTITSDVSLLAVFPIWETICKADGVKFTYTYVQDYWSLGHFLFWLVLKTNTISYKYLDNYEEIFGVKHNDRLLNS